MTQQPKNDDTYTKFDFADMLNTSVIKKPTRFRTLIIGDSLLRNQHCMFDDDSIKVVCIPGGDVHCVMNFLTKIFSAQEAVIKETGEIFSWKSQQLNELNNIVGVTVD